MKNLLFFRFFVFVLIVVCFPLADPNTIENMLGLDALVRRPRPHGRDQLLIPCEDVPEHS